MSTYYSPGCKDEKAHVCDSCKSDDGRPTLYWSDNNFDLCYDCLTNIFVQHIDPSLKVEESIKVNRRTIPEALRDKILARDGYACVKCGGTDLLQIDHITPFARGGKTTEDNLQSLCRKCNLEKRAG